MFFTIQSYYPLKNTLGKQNIRHIFVLSWSDLAISGILPQYRTNAEAASYTQNKPIRLRITPSIVIIGIGILVGRIFAFIDSERVALKFSVNQLHDEVL